MLAIKKYLYMQDVLMLKRCSDATGSSAITSPEVPRSPDFKKMFWCNWKFCQNITRSSDYASTEVERTMKDSDASNMHDTLIWRSSDWTSECTSAAKQNLWYSDVKNSDQVVEKSQQ